MHARDRCKTFTQIKGDQDGVRGLLTGRAPVAADSHEAHADNQDGAHACGEHGPRLACMTVERRRTNRGVRNEITFERMLSDPVGPSSKEGNFRLHQTHPG